MDWATFVKKENVRKAEEKLKGDFDVASKQSINIREAKSLGIEMEGSIFLISGTDEGVERCKELIKEFSEDLEEEKAKKAWETVKEEEDKAAEAFGGILG